MCLEEAPEKLHVQIRTLTLQERTNAASPRTSCGALQLEEQLASRKTGTILVSSFLHIHVRTQRRVASLNPLCPPRPPPAPSWQKHLLDLQCVALKRNNSDNSGPSFTQVQGPCHRSARALRQLVLQEWSETALVNGDGMSFANLPHLANL